MASPQAMGIPKSLHSEPFDLLIDFTTTTSGAVPSTLTRARGVASVVRNSAGKYTITLSERWSFLGGFDACVLIASLTATKGNGWYLVSEAVNSATPTIVVQFVQVSGAAADVDDGARIVMTARLHNQAD